MKNLFFALVGIFFFASCNQAQTTNNSPLTPENNSFEQELKSGYLNLLASTDNAYYYIDEPRENVYLYTEVKADKYSNENIKRTPLNLSIVLDRSGSMEGEKLDYAKQAAITAIDLLSDEDYVSIVAYESGVQVIVEPTLVKDKEAITSAIQRIESGGGTFLSGGMEKGLELVKSTYKDDYLNRVFLLSDGLANEGISSISELSDIASFWRESESISLSTFGIGIDFNEDLMTELSEAGGGNYYFIASPNEMSAIFQKELTGLLQLVAKKATLDINYPADLLNLSQVFGYRYEASPGKINVNFGDVFSEETKAVVVKFSINELEEKAIVISTILNFIDLSDNQTAKELVAENTIMPHADQVVVKEKMNNLCMQQVALFESNFQMEQAAKELDKGNYDAARDILETNDAYIHYSIEEYGDNEIGELQKISESNSKYNTDVEEFESLSIDEQKYIQKENKSTTYEIKKKK